MIEIRMTIDYICRRITPTMREQQQRRNESKTITRNERAELFINHSFTTGFYLMVDVDKSDDDIEEEMGGVE
jgi:hypothetical protein